MEGTLETVRELSHKLEILITTGCTAHFHHQVELMAVRRGTVTATIDGVTRRLRAGNAVIADSYAVHTWTPEPRAEGVVLIVPTRYLKEYQAAMKGRTFSHAFITDGTEGQRILKLLELLKSERPDSLSAHGLVNAILGEFVERLPLRDRDTADRTALMRDVLLYLTENFAEPITLDSLSKRFGYTSTHFSRIFNAYTGEGLSDYVGALRSERAAALLRSGLTATDAALAAGFQSMRTFYRSFREKYSCTPRDYTNTL